MLNIAVGSTNPAKLEAVHQAFEYMNYDIQLTGLDAPSGVSEQPMTDEETMLGALNRALRCPSRPFRLWNWAGRRSNGYPLWDVPVQLCRRRSS